MKNYKQRINSEKTELDSKLEKLKQFITTDDFNKLSETNKDLLTQQEYVMTKYSLILNLRLSI